MIVVRKQSAVLAAKDDVLFDQDISAFIGLNPPAAIVASRYIMHPVVTDARAGRAAGVDASHVAEHALADVVNVIEFDDISLRMVCSEILDRTNGDTRVEQVVDVVVND